MAGEVTAGEVTAGEVTATVNEQVRAAFDAAPDKQAFMLALRDFLHELSPQQAQPVDNIRWVPIEKVVSNDYNPNSVAKNEMRLLYTSISHDGYTQPVVTVHDPETDRYVIVDGFHRYTTMMLHEDIRQRCNGLLPIVVIAKDINDRMASTVRHNRARGKHSISGMASMVFSMLENGWSDADICAELGLETDELLRLKHVTGFSKLFEDVDYRRAWETRNQIKLRVEAERAKNAARPSGRKTGGKVRGKGPGGEPGADAAGEATLDDQYQGDIQGQGGVRLPTDPEIAARQAQMEGHFRTLVDKANAGFVEVTCPGCGEDFFVEKGDVA